jgi:DNA-binding NarL/FixJ family response regulator
VRTSALEDFQDYVKRCSLDDFGQDDPRSFLNERECATFVLHYYHQWKKKKIGGLLGVSEKMVQTYWNNSLHKIWKYLRRRDHEVPADPGAGHE